MVHKVRKLIKSVDTCNNEYTLESSNCSGHLNILNISKNSGLSFACVKK